MKNSTGKRKAIDTHPAKDEIKQNWIRLAAYIGQVINGIGKTFEKIKTDEDLKTQKPHQRSHTKTKQTAKTTTINGWHVGRDFTNHVGVSAKPPLSSQRILREDPFHEPEQLITEKYRNKIRRPQHHRPVLRNVSPQIRRGRKNLHRNQSTRPEKTQNKLLFHFLPSKALSPQQRQHQPS